ncbi:MAG: hypothetical protein IJ055_09220, partial [Oscillospiraceae bacterium]|nr:hypothetical protein [Oscillospiraceae bacterium]
HFSDLVKPFFKLFQNLFRGSAPPAPEVPFPLRQLYYYTTAAPDCQVNFSHPRRPAFCAFSRIFRFVHHIAHHRIKNQSLHWSNSTKSQSPPFHFSRFMV